MFLSSLCPHCNESFLALFEVQGAEVSEQMHDLNLGFPEGRVDSRTSDVQKEVVTAAAARGTFMCSALSRAPQHHL